MVPKSGSSCKTISDDFQAIFDSHTKAIHSNAVAEINRALEGSVMACPNVWLPHVMSLEKGQTS
jgi:hypothetical protein